MARRIEAGPIVVGIGALLLLVSLFLDWFAPGSSAWTVFEALDLLLAALAIGALVAAIGLLAPELAALDRRWLGPLALLTLVIVASQLVDRPPGAAGGGIEEGGWLGLAGALLMAAGALLSFSRVRLALTVEGRDPRRRFSAVDARPAAAGAAAGTGEEPPPAARAASGPGEPGVTEAIDAVPAPSRPPAA